MRPHILKCKFKKTQITYSDSPISINNSQSSIRQNCKQCTVIYSRFFLWQKIEKTQVRKIILVAIHIQKTFFRVSPRRCFLSAPTTTSIYGIHFYLRLSFKLPANSTIFFTFPNLYFPFLLVFRIGWNLKTTARTWRISWLAAHLSPRTVILCYSLPDSIIIIHNLIYIYI